MEKLTYKQAFDKITEAYIKDEIKVLDPRFCFCGTLAPDNGWPFENEHRLTTYPYSIEEYGKMEQALFSKFPNAQWMPYLMTHYDYGMEKYFDKEEVLFDGMCAALEVLKQIHKERGENVEGFQFEKRQIKELI